MVTAMICQSACVVPTDIERPSSERPPVIDLKTIQPAEWWDVSLDMDCTNGRTEFSFGYVSDPDVDDALTARWYFDYWDYSISFNETAIPADGRSVRRNGDRWTLENNSVYIKEGREIHTIEVIVTDRPFNDAGVPPERSIAEGAGYDYFIWYIHLSAKDGVCPEEMGR